MEVEFLRHEICGASFSKKSVTVGAAIFFTVHTNQIYLSKLGKTENQITFEVFAESLGSVTMKKLTACQ